MYLVSNAGFGFSVRDAEVGLTGWSAQADINFLLLTLFVCIHG